ncbi:MAG: alpha/beta fold hydrolase [Micromonosporaceae bacterium]
MNPTTATRTLAPGTHTIDIDGIRQRYHVAGTGPVCIAHSGGPGIGWEYLRMPAVEQHLTMVYVEPIGTGESGRLPDPRDYTLDRYARLLHGLVEHLGQQRTIVLGHSHGGFVAQHYALAHPERLAGLILYDTSPATGPDFWPAALRNLELFAQRHPARPEAQDIVMAFREISELDDDAGFTALLRRVFPAYFGDYWGRESELEKLRAGLRCWIDPMHGEGPPFDVRDALGSIGIPTLIVVGRHDFICGPSWAQLLHRGIPGSRLITLRDSGHMGHLEQPEGFARAVADFTRALAT